MGRCGRVLAGEVRRFPNNWLRAEVVKTNRGHFVDPGVHWGGGSTVAGYLCKRQRRYDLGSDNLGRGMLAGYLSPAAQIDAGLCCGA